MVEYLIAIESAGAKLRVMLRRVVGSTKGPTISAVNAFGNLFEVPHPQNSEPNLKRRF